MNTAKTPTLFISLLFLITSQAYGLDVQRMDEVVSYYHDKNEFMGSVLVAKGNDVLFSKSYGYANVEWDTPNSPTTKFRLGSITKQFTAVAILQLEEEGKLKITDNVNKYIDDLPDTWKDITIFNLLTHSAGIFNVTALPDFNDYAIKPMQPREVLELVFDKPLDFKPGTNMRYSNSGFIALGLIVELVSGQPYAEYMQEHIFTPLNMTSTGYDSNTRIIKQRAMGYTPNESEGMVNADYVHMSIPHGAGALYSTTEDLLKWNNALYNEKIISKKSVKKMTTVFKNDYALGIGVQDSPVGKNFSHGGGIQGFNTFLSYYPASNITVVALSNLNGNAPNTIVTQLAALAHGQPITLPNERQSIELTANDLQTLVGTYSGPVPKLEFKITVENEQLQGQITGQRKLPLFPESKHKFFSKTVDAQLEFVEEGNKISKLILSQGGRNIEWPKISDTVAVRTAINLTSEQLSKFIGKYPLGGALKLTITMDGEILTGQVSGRPTFTLAAESETRLFSRDPDLFIDFDMDEKGNATGLTLNAGPNVMKGTKE